MLCGLAIVDEAAAAAKVDPQRPIRVGVGVHAGETVEGPEGFVGSAVNLAARVCSAAAPGEVLVTDTVRTLTRTNVPVRFTPRGRRRLKGIAEPVTLFDIADPGWRGYRVYVDAVGLMLPGEGTLDTGRIQVVYTNPCYFSEVQSSEIVGSAPADLVAALKERPYLVVSDPRPRNLGGSTGLSVTVEVRGDSLDGCEGPRRAALFPVGQDTFNALPGEVFDVVAVDVEGTTVSFLIAGTDQDAFREQADAVLRTVRFAP